MTFHVSGTPAPGGSKNAFAAKGSNGYTGRVALVDAGVGNKEWRAKVREAATLAKLPMLEGPVALNVDFLMPRPKNHFNKDGTVKPNAPLWHTSKPDRTKLLRSTEDALVGLTWRDDSQVCIEGGMKFYSQFPGAQITITPAPQTPE